MVDDVAVHASTPAEQGVDVSAFQKGGCGDGAVEAGFEGVVVEGFGERQNGVVTMEAEEEAAKVMQEELFCGLCWFVSLRGGLVAIEYVRCLTADGRKLGTEVEDA